MSFDDSLRVCHLGKYYPPAPGGMETHVQTLARAQADLGADVSVVCVEHARRNADSLNPPDAATPCGPVPFLREDDGPVRVMRATRRRSLGRLDLCPGLGDLLRGLEDQGVQILHLHTPNPTMLLALTRYRSPIPLIITHHSDIIAQRLLKYAMRPFERHVYGRAVRVQATSPVYRQGSAFLARYDDRIEVLPLGLDLRPFSHPSAEALAYARRLHAEHATYGGDTQAADGAVPLWLAVGRLVYYKGLRIAVEALTRVSGKLLIVGTGGLEAELRHLAQRLGVADRIIWRGYLSRDELAGAYHAATALWFPSNARSEAFGLVQVEAMASGCPVVNTHIRHSGVPWVSQHDVSGLTIPINDANALAGAARLLLENPSLRQRLASGARRRAAEEFDHTVMGRRSLEIYNRALNGAPASEVRTMSTTPPAAAALPFDRFAPAAVERGAIHRAAGDSARADAVRAKGDPDAALADVEADAAADNLPREHSGKASAHRPRSVTLRS